MSIKLSLAVTLALAAGAAHASCKQADARGTWITYQSAFIAKDPHVGQCKLIVDKAGNVSDQGSYCEFVTFNTPQIPTDGSIKVNRDCSAVVNLGVGGFVGQVQIEKSKQSFIGRFTAQGGAVSGTTTATKQ